MPANLPSAVRIATRASQLALWQANHVADLLRNAAPDVAVEIVHVSTTGDRVQTTALSEFGGVGVFTREVQNALLDGRADIAVHSLKDLPTEPTPGLTLAVVPQREVRFDALVLPASQSSGDLAALPPNARVGTGSLRRQAQLRHLRPDVRMEEVRGNVDTRLRKLDAGEFDALILAAAGLTRLGLADRISQRLEPPAMYPAVGQGAIGIECRADDVPVIELLGRLTDHAAWTEVTAERSLLAALRAGCHAPLGVLTTHVDRQLRLDAVVLSADGVTKWTASATRPSDQAAELGRIVARQLLDQGVEAVLERPQPTTGDVSA
jgi:hydroxymethylbilane synthase